jgi:endonuclease G
MKYLVLIAVLLTGGCGGSSKEQPVDIVEKFLIEPTCSDHAPYGLPIGLQQEIILCKSAFIVSYNTVNKNPNYVSYILSGRAGVESVERVYDFKTDPELTLTEQASNDDYVNSGYDRSHLIAWADFLTLHEALESNFFTNITPMTPELNRGLWLSLEIKARDWSIMIGDLNVIAGVIASDEVIGKDVNVPGYLYKIIFESSTNSMVAFLFPNNAIINSDNVNDYAISVDALEILTSIDFFPSMNEELETALENQIVWYF